MIGKSYITPAHIIKLKFNWYLYCSIMFYVDHYKYLTHDMAFPSQSMCYAPFTPAGESLATGRDRGKLHLSLVVAPSLPFVTTFRRTVS